MARVVVVGASDEFPAALMMRTLYAMMGPGDWLVEVYGPLRRMRILDESRVPLSVALGRLRVVHGSLGGLRECIRVDPGGLPASSLQGLEAPLLLDYTGSVACEREVRVRGLGLPPRLLHYEAVAVLYEVLARRMAWSVEEPSAPPGPREARLAVRLARRVWDMLSNLDGYSVVKPSAAVYILRKLLKGMGLILDPSSTRIVVDQVEGGVRQEVYMRVYDRRARPMGEARLTYDSRRGRLILEAPGLRLELGVDRLRRVVLLGGGVVVKRLEAPRDSIPWSTLAGKDAEP